MAPKKKVNKNEKWENILKQIYSTPGKSGAFFSSRKLQGVLKSDFGISVNEKKNSKLAGISINIYYS